MVVRVETTDWNTVNAAIGEDEYGLADLDLHGKLVFDVGAHVGSIGVWAATRGAVSVLVEPIPENVEMIQRNITLNGVRHRCHALEAAAGEDGDEITIRYGFSHTPSARAHAFIGNMGGVDGEDGKEVKVPGISLGHLVLTYGIPDIIKLDCEGGEWSWLADPAIGTVPLIVGEWHPFPGRRTWEDVFYLLPRHEVTFTGPEDGPGGFRACWREPGWWRS
jgi:FkbM family methyltransferase